MVQLELQNLSKKFDQFWAVKEVALTIAPSQIFCLLGTSGCGKTTTLKMINRLVEPTSGDVLINGLSTKRVDGTELRRAIGFVKQKGGLFPHLTIAQNMQLVQEVHPQLLNFNQRLQEYFHLVQLNPQKLLGRYPHEISGGQQQRLTLVRALLTEAPLLLMDEPFGALDPITRRKIQNDFKALNQLLKKTVVLVTHDIDEAFFLADRVALMQKGKIVQEGDFSSFRLQPQNEFVTEFMQAQHRDLPW